MSLGSKRSFEGWAGRYGYNLWSVFPENGKLVFYGSHCNPHGFHENHYSDSDMDRELETIELKKDESKILTGGEAKQMTTTAGAGAGEAKEKEGDEGHRRIYQEVIRSFALPHNDNDNVNTNRDEAKVKVKSVLTRDGSLNLNLNIEASFPPRTSRIRTSHTS